MPRFTTIDTATYRFPTSNAAWNFARACDAAKLQAGYPGLKEPTVKVQIPSCTAREEADRLAGSNPVDYEFGKPTPV